MRNRSDRAGRTWRISLGCAAALAGATAVIGIGAAPSAARPDMGVSGGSLVVAGGPSGAAAVPGPTLLAGSTGVHVDGGWLLR
jgi:hypothetical protein